MVGAHVALAASGRQSRDFNRRSVPRVTCGATADRPICIRLAHSMALDTTAHHGGGSFQFNERIGSALASARMKFLGECDLFGGKSFLAINGRPGRRRMPAAQKLLI